MTDFTPPEGYVSVEPQIFKWDVVGKQFAGQVISRSFDNSQFENLRLLMKDDSGEPYIVFCPKVLQSKMAFVDDGEEVLIVYYTDEKSAHGNPTKLFQVFRKKPVAVDSNPELDTTPPF